jgi:hypothetical protein
VDRDWGRFGERRELPIERGELLSELLGAAEREPVQNELSAVRVLFELLGFLLKQLSAISHQLSAVSNTTPPRCDPF